MGSDQRPNLRVPKSGFLETADEYRVLNIVLDFSSLLQTAHSPNVDVVGDVAHDHTPMSGAGRETGPDWLKMTEMKS